MKYAKYFIVLLLAAIPLFQHLNDKPLRIWDETRLAMNSYEMNKDGNFLVTHIDGNPDLWNTKPPMMIWMQVVCFKIFGENELATRLPSAIAAFCICILLLVFSSRYIEEPWLGLIAILVFVTSEGVVSDHGSRTGDYDIPLSLFNVLYCLSFFNFIESKKIKYFYIAIAGLICAVLTKGVAGFFFAPALVLYSIYSKQFLPILKSKHTYFGILGVIFFVGGYYVAREIAIPGYWKAVMENELGGRFLDTNEGHRGDILFYIDGFTISRFKFWIMYIPCAVLLCFALKESKLKQFVIYCIILASVFFIIISSSSSKLTHYDLPLYPFFALIVASLILTIFKLISKWEIKPELTKFNVFPYIFLFLLFLTPYLFILDKTYLPKEIDWENSFYKMGYVLKDAIKGNINLNGYYYLSHGYDFQNTFYVRILEDKGVNIKSIADFSQLKPGNKAITWHDEAKQYLDMHYNYTVIKDIDNVRLYQINSLKTP